MSVIKHIPSGTRFARLVVIEPSKPCTTGRSASLCLCDCGNKKIVSNGNLRSKEVRSCGCLKRWPRKHGNCGTPAYFSWAAMIKRCNNPNCGDFPRYGGRGIKVCDRWMDFRNFLADMGERPAGLTIERINNDLGYIKNNCKWATSKEQARNMCRNRLLTHNGETLTLAEWAEKTKISSKTLSRRFNYGWPTERMLTEQPRQYQSRVT